MQFAKITVMPSILQWIQLLLELLLSVLKSSLPFFLEAIQSHNQMLIYFLHVNTLYERVSVLKK